jgi:hypothetical protein
LGKMCGAATHFPQNIAFLPAKPEEPLLYKHFHI